MTTVKNAKKTAAKTKSATKAKTAKTAPKKAAVNQKKKKAIYEDDLSRSARDAIVKSVATALGDALFNCGQALVKKDKKSGLSVGMFNEAVSSFIDATYVTIFKISTPEECAKALAQLTTMSMVGIRGADAFGLLSTEKDDEE